MGAARESTLIAVLAHFGKEGGWAATTGVQSSRPTWGQRHPGARRANARASGTPTRWGRTVLQSRPDGWGEPSLPSYGLVTD